MSDNGTPTLYTTDDTGNYVEYTPPDPPAFSETLPDDIRDNEHLQGVEDSSTLARYYVDLKKDYLAPPETADGYEFQKPENFRVTDEEMGEFKKIAFESGMNQKQFESVMNLSVKSQAETLKAYEKQINDAHDAAEAELKTEWGNEYDKKLEAAKSFLNHEKIADEGFKKFLDDTRFADSPVVVKFFEKLSRLISEDAFTKPGAGGGDPGPQKGEDGRPILNFPSMDKE